MLKKLIAEIIAIAIINFSCANTYQIKHIETLEDVAGKFTIESDKKENNKYIKAAELIEQHGDLNKENAPISTESDTSRIIQYVKEFNFENYKLLFYNSKENKKSLFENNPLSSFREIDHLEIKILADTSLILVEDGLNGKVIGYIKRLNGKNIEFSDDKKYQKLFNELFDKVYKDLKSLK